MAATAAEIIKADQEHLIHPLHHPIDHAESNESAIKTARFYWKARGKPDKFKVIARQNAYHGVTQQAMSATGMAAYWKMFEPRVPGFVHIPTCYPYRQQDSKPGETAGQTAARLLDEAISREGQDTVAAFIAEPIHGGGGVLYPDDDYFPLVRQVCMERERLWEKAAKMGTRLFTGLQQAFKDHPNAGDIRGGKGLLAAVELVEDKASKRSFAADKKIGPRIQQEMTKRGVITRVRPTSGAHPATGDIIMFAPALVITEAEVDRLVSVTRDAVKSVLSV